MTPTYQPAQPTAEIRPKLIWVWIAVALMVLAAVLTIGLIISGLSGIQSKFDGLTRVQPGQSIVVDLDAGEYAVYVEGSTPTVALPDVTVVGAAGEVPVTQTQVTEEYDTGNFQGRSNSRFTIDSSGSYEIVNNSSDLIAIGPPLFGNLIRAVLLPFLLGAVLGITGLVMLIVTLVRRSRAKSRLMTTHGAVSAGQGPRAPGPAVNYPTANYPTGQAPAPQTPTAPSTSPTVPSSPSDSRPSSPSPSSPPSPPSPPSPSSPSSLPPPPPPPGGWPSR